MKTSPLLSACFVVRMLTFLSSYLASAGMFCTRFGPAGVLGGVFLMGGIDVCMHVYLLYSVSFIETSRVIEMPDTNE